MRKIYLIRHCHPDFATGRHMCLGRTDTPLGTLGRMQACLLGEQLKGVGLSSVYTSPLSRCRETAAVLERESIIHERLAEQDMGLWDGLDFTQIKEQWPELYERRSAEPLLVPEGAESLAEVQRRILPAVEEIIKGSSGNIAIVTHASVIQAILSYVESLALADSRPLRPAYASYTLLGYDGQLKLLEEAKSARVQLTPDIAEKLLDAAVQSGKIKAHCRAVAREALRIAEALPIELDLGLLVSAALLHDIARGEPDHAELAGDWLKYLGYDKAAELVSQHHDFKKHSIDEAAILYIADKCIQEDTQVKLYDRFEGSRSRCSSDEAMAAWKLRRDMAMELKEKINGLAGKELII